MTKICIFNSTTNLIDVTDGVSSYTGSPATAGAPVVLNSNGALDSSFFNSNPITVTAAVALQAGDLVNLYYGTVNGISAVYAQLANAASSSSLPAMGFVNAAYNVGDTATVQTSGIANVPFSTGFSPNNIGQPIYLSNTVAGSVTLTRPSNPDLIQPLGFIYQVGGTSNSYVQFPFESFPLASVNQTPIATSSSAGVVKPDNSTIVVNGTGVITATTATTSQLGVVKPDGTSIRVNSGVISVSSSYISGSGLDGYLPLFTGGSISPPTSTNIVTTSHLDDGVTISGTITSSEPIVVQGELTSTLILPYQLYNQALNPLPSPSPQLQGAQAIVSDATSPSYMAAYQGGGTVTCAVICSYDGSASPPTYIWMTH